MRKLAILALAGAAAFVPQGANALGRDAGALPACGSALAIGMLRDRFAFDQDKIWRTGLAISRILNVARAAADVRTELSVRRYCEATVILNNRSQPTFAYMIEQRRDSLVPRFNYCVLIRNIDSVGDCEARPPKSKDNN